MKKVVRVTKPSDRLSLDSPKFGMKEGPSKGHICMSKKVKISFFGAIYRNLYLKK